MMRNLKDMFYRIKTGNSVHGYSVVIQTEVVVNATNKIDAKNQAHEIRELIADLVRRNDFVGRELDVRVRSL